MLNYFGASYVLHFDSWDAAGKAFMWAVVVGYIIFLIIRYGGLYLAFRQKLHALKERNVVVAQYDAPPSMPPAFFGTVVDNRTSINDFTATILDLTVKGYLKLDYDEERKEFRVTRTKKEAADVKWEHQRFVLGLPGAEGVWASEIKNGGNLNTNEFNFLVLRDLQNAGLYQFNRYINKIPSSAFYIYTILRGLLLGLVKPWNWPGFIVCAFFPYVGMVWLIVSVILYNRIGVYNYKTDAWEEVWPEAAGYYNYLRIVEADNRSFEMKDLEHAKLDQHDPYLVSALLLPEWGTVFVPIQEIGAGGSEYRTH